MFQLDTNETIEASDKKRIGLRLLPYLQERTVVIEEELEVGDLSFPGRDSEGKFTLNFGVEFKAAPSDLMASMRDGRLVNQLIRMVNHYTFSYLLLIGKPLQINTESGKVQERKKGKWQDSPFSYHYINSIFARFEAAGGTVREVRDVEHAAALLLSLHHYWEKPEHEAEMFVKKRYKITDWQMLDEPLAEIYERIPGVSIGQALILKEVAPSMIDLALMTEGQMRSIKVPKGVRPFGGRQLRGLLSMLEGR